MGKDEEKTFHDRYVTKSDVRSLESAFYSEVAKENETRLALEHFGRLEGKDLLVYGSGHSPSLARLFLDRGARVTAIDISPETVSKLSDSMKSRGCGDRFSAIVMDCERLEFPDESFDFVFSRSILHHLDVRTALKEIARVLKPGGKMAALEPLGTNPVINLYRRLTPGSRTSDEHPFLPSDLASIRDAFPDSRFTYLYFLSIASYLYRMVDRDPSRFRSLFHRLNRLDAGLLSIMPPSRYLFWDVFIECSRSPLQVGFESTNLHSVRTT